MLQAVCGGDDLPNALARVRDTLADDRDRALVTEITTGTLRWLGALDCAAGGRHVADLTERALAGLGALDAVRLIGPDGLQSRSPVISFVIDGLHPHDICQMLDSFGVALRGGHHCAQPLMDFFGIAGATRASLTFYNNHADIDALLNGLAATIKKFT